MRRKENEVPDFLKLAKEIKEECKSYVGVTALNFFIDSFQKQGFTNSSFEPWQKRSNDTRPGGALLVKSANLRNSLRLLKVEENKIIIGTTSPYAKIHNDGGTINIKLTKKARKFFWFMYKISNDTRYKWMAISKKEHLTIKMPKRQFIGESQVLNNQLEDWLMLHIEKRFKEA